jgi:hypothetical protein
MTGDKYFKTHDKLTLKYSNQVNALRRELSRKLKELLAEYERSLYPEGR